MLKKRKKPTKQKFTIFLFLRICKYFFRVVFQIWVFDEITQFVTLNPKITFPVIGLRMRMCEFLVGVIQKQIIEEGSNLVL